MSEDIPHAVADLYERTFVLKPEIDRTTIAQGCFGCAADHMSDTWTSAGRVYTHAPDQDARDLCLALRDLLDDTAQRSLCGRYAAIWVEDTEEAMAEYVVRRMGGEP